MTATTPYRIGRWRSMPILTRFVFNPMPVLRRLHRDYGPFVILTYPQSRGGRPALLGAVTDSGLYRAMFTDAERWRNVNIVFRGFKNHASQRLSVGFTRLRDVRHAHYRRLIAKPLSRPAVAVMSEDMAVYAQRLVDSWPREETTDLIRLTQDIMHGLAIGLLFGNDYERAHAITRMIELQNDAYRLIPGRDYFTWLWNASRQERLILEWAEQKRGNVDARDLLSIIANSSDEYGLPASQELLAGILSFTFGAAYESCRNGLAWTLVMLAQHPAIACDLGDEIVGALKGAMPTMDRIDHLPLLDGVVKEGLRLFPPVPILARKTQVPTSLGDAQFAANTRVLVSAFLINRNPDLYPEPDRFRPDRWRGLEPPPEDYAVFGLGGRTCPGFLFASQMVKISLATMLSRFRVEIAPDAQIDYVSRVMLSPYPKIPARLRGLDWTPRAARITGRIHDLVDLPQPA